MWNCKNRSPICTRCVTPIALKQQSMNTIKILLLPMLVVVAIVVLLELSLRIAGITPSQGPLSADLATYDLSLIHI